MFVLCIENTSQIGTNFTNLSGFNQSLQLFNRICSRVRIDYFCTEMSIPYIVSCRSYLCSVLGRPQKDFGHSKKSCFALVLSKTSTDPNKTFFFKLPKSEFRKISSYFQALVFPLTSCFRVKRILKIRPQIKKL